MKLETLTLYRNLLKDPVIQTYLEMMRALSEPFDGRSFAKNYCELIAKLLEARGDFNFAAYFYDLVLYDDNCFTRGGEQEDIQTAVRYDLSLLREVLELKPGEMLHTASQAAGGELGRQIAAFPVFRMDGAQEYRVRLDAETLCEYHRLCGYGMFAKHRFFVWNGKMEPVQNFDAITFRDMIGYELQTQTVRRNTEQFLDGYRASNVLLYGDRGVGKSSTVKALANEYAHRGLRIIELPIARVGEVSALIEEIKNTRLKFIIYIDDFVLSQEGSDYSALKSMLEGSVVKKPDHVLVYATGNRRHLLKETFAQRGEEVSRADAIQEQMSLADRFPITVTYLAPAKDEYLSIVKELAGREGLEIGEETLFNEAMAWQMRYNGMSPRTAVNFIAALKYKKNQKRLANPEKS